ncbi:MAG: arginine N-succinyltransferase [Thermodesulfobacteriota bacterium]
MTHKEPESDIPRKAEQRPRFSGIQVLGIVLLTIVLTLGLGYWAISAFLFPEPFTPVRLNQHEQQRLEKKLEAVNRAARYNSQKEAALQPEPYTEKAARREVHFTEKEINSLLARNTDLARKFAVDLSADLASLKILLPLDPEMPVFGGKTLKVTAGLELGMDQGRPRVVFKGISVWGVPLPNVWLGNLKDFDLIAKFGNAGGFWQAMAEGVREIEVEEGRLRVRLEK